MLTIRLQRVGRKNSPDFRIVLAEKHRSASKKIVQVFGKYNPKTKDFNLADQDALLDRIKQNIEVSPTVRNLLIQNKLIEGKKVKAWRPKIKEETETPKSAEAPDANGNSDLKPEQSKPEEKSEQKKPAPAETSTDEQKEVKKDSPEAIQEKPSN